MTVTSTITVHIRTHTTMARRTAASLLLNTLEMPQSCVKSPAYEIEVGDKTILSPTNVAMKLIKMKFNKDKPTTDI